MGSGRKVTEPDGRSGLGSDRVDDTRSCNGTDILSPIFEAILRDSRERMETAVSVWSEAMGTPVRDEEALQASGVDELITRSFLVEPYL